MIVFLLALSLTSFAADNNKILNETVDFFDWLVAHQKDFGNCSPKKVGNDIELCDKTLVPLDNLKKMFSSTPEEVLAMLQKMNIKTEILCDQKNSGVQTFAKSCLATSNNPIFNKVTALHGQYLPEEKKILLRSSASKGSLIHEYIHSLQSENKNMIFGKVYKSERNRFKKELTRIMDENIVIIQNLTAKNQKNKISPYLQEFSSASQLLQYFGNWQDLIDERGIFLLYLNFAKDLNIAKEDLELAQLNMKHICKNEKLKVVIPAAQCPK
ncbi:MAG: hypothetical protein AB7I27_18000 [Bacteriovoracaceae bacterium]